MTVVKCHSRGVHSLRSDLGGAERRKARLRGESLSVDLHYTSANCVVPLPYIVGCAVPVRIILDATSVGRLGHSEVGEWKD